MRSCFTSNWSYYKYPILKKFNKISETTTLKSVKQQLKKQLQKGLKIFIQNSGGLVEVWRCRLAENMWAA
jgi:hypothetical protein